MRGSMKDEVPRRLPTRSHQTQSQAILTQVSTLTTYTTLTLGEHVGWGNAVANRVSTAAASLNLPRERLRGLS